MDKHDVVTEVRSKLTGETLEHFNWLLCVWNTDRDHDYPSTDKDRHEFRQYLRQCTNVPMHRCKGFTKKSWLPDGMSMPNLPKAKQYCEDFTYRDGA